MGWFRRRRGWRGGGGEGSGREKRTRERTKGRETQIGQNNILVGRFA